MADRKSPELDLLVLCSYVEYDGNGQPFRLVEPLHTVLVSPDDQGQLSAPEFALYVQMTDEDASGSFDFTVQVRTVTNIVIHHQVEAERVTFYSRVHPLKPFEHVFLIHDLVFDAPGVYHFHVMCGHASMSDRPGAPRAARLRVIRSEDGGDLS